MSTDERYGVPVGGSFPLILLRSDRWDDFGFKTTFHAEYWESPGDSRELGTVKILQRGLRGTTNPIDLPPEVALGPEYCSLGQTLSYYENLIANLGRPHALALLTQMQDAALLAEHRISFVDEPAWGTSLLREGSARRALEDAEQLLGGEAPSEKSTLEFTFQSSVGGANFETEFKFGDSDFLPDRLNAVIGYNGVGKTRLLANLAHVAVSDIRTRGHSVGYGQITPSDIAFGRVIAISYSAFDSFATPKPNTESPDAPNLSTARDYVYCGLRDVADIVDSGEGEDEVHGNAYRLKSSEEIAGELRDALGRIASDGRWQILNDALAPLLREPSFQLSSTQLDFQEEARVWWPVFEQLSTGHKIALNIVVQMASRLENKSLVLIDEPESHLHPPLLAALMKGASSALEATNSYAVIATHSPVVLQEIAARYVQILRRYGNITAVERPSAETFGENVGVLTRNVFNLDNTEADHQGVLHKLGISHGLDGIGELFPDGLSAQALALVMQADRTAADEDPQVADSDV